MFHKMLTKCRVKHSKGTKLIILHILKVKKEKEMWGKRERNKETKGKREQERESKVRCCGNSGYGSLSELIPFCFNSKCL